MMRSVEVSNEQLSHQLNLSIESVQSVIEFILQLEPNLVGNREISKHIQNLATDQIALIDQLTSLKP